MLLYLEFHLAHGCQCHYLWWASLSVASLNIVHLIGCVRTHLTPTRNGLFPKCILTIILNKPISQGLMTVRPWQKNCKGDHQEKSFYYLCLPLCLFPWYIYLQPTLLNSQVTFLFEIVFSSFLSYFYNCILKVLPFSFILPHQVITTIDNLHNYCLG